jgi:cystathionine beta-lyase/cystathionine gamma-synthase
MSAVAAAINTLSHNNIKIVTFGSYYRKTYSIIKNLKDKFGIIHEHYDSSNDYLKGDAGDEGTIFFVESPSNPFLRLIDIKKIRNKVPESKIILDTTFQGLLNDKGFIQYADLIVVSCTKYIGGHNDLFGGIVACANDELYSRIWDERSMKGGIIDNMSAYLLLRSLRTYDLRIERSLENVKYILEFLENDKAIKKIYYPGAFENSDQSELFTKMHYHGGAVVTFEMNHNINLKKNISNLFSTKMAPSFGSVDSLIEIPIYMSHWGQSKEFVKSLKLNEYSVRLSVGNEPVEYIINDLKRLIAK